MDKAREVRVCKKQPRTERNEVQNQKVHPPFGLRSNLICTALRFTLGYSSNRSFRDA